MKKALLVDTSRAAYPLFIVLQEAGLDVWVIGGNPDDFLAKISPNYKYLDYSNVGALSAFIAEGAFDYLVPGCNDLSYASCAAVGHGRYPGIDSLQSTLELTCKDNFRALAGSLGIPVPATYDTNVGGLTCPVIVKPVDSYSGRGITVLHSLAGENLAHALDKARRESRSQAALVEAFVEGQLISHTAFVRKYEIVADFVVQEDCTIHPFTVDTSRLMTGLPSRLIAAFREYICRIALSLKLEDGLLHSQIIVSGTSHWFIEVTRRCPGDLYSALIEYSTGYDYAANYVAPFIGKPSLPLPVASEMRRIVRKTVASKQAGFFSCFVFDKRAPVTAITPMVSPAQVVREAPFGRAGVAFFEAESDQHWDTIYNKALRQELVWYI